MLIAAGLANISPISIIGNLYYPFTMGSLRPARYLIPLSETVFIKKKNRNICQSKEKPYLCARYYELVA